MTERIIVYSTHCPKCKVLESKLSAAGIDYQENTDTDYMLAQGWKEVPMLQVGNQIMNFSEAIKWIQSR